MKALVLERDLKLNLRDIELDEPLGPRDVRIKVHTVGICGSDIHYYQHGRIGPFVVNAPMVLGHEASGVVVEVGSEVTNLQVGDRVTMEPGIPDPNSRASRLGMYNLDPAVRFWATPPVHGVIRPTVVHPADFTFKIPDNISMGEAAMVEPLAVGMHAAEVARINPGDVAVVVGAGPIGMVTAMSALAGGCSRVIMSDIKQPRLDLAARLGPITPVNAIQKNLGEVVLDTTEGWGADIVFECSGSSEVAAGIFELLCPGGCLVYVGMPVEPIRIDMVAAQVKEAHIQTIFRYAHVYPRALALMGSGQIDVKPLITDKFKFEQSIEAFGFSCDMRVTSIKTQIEMAG